MYDGLQVFILALHDLMDQRMTRERHGSPVSSGDERTPIPPGAQTNDFLSGVRTVPTSAVLKSGESGVTVDALAAILAALGVSLREFFQPFKAVVRPRTPRRRG